jgi:hypothetical protein
MNLLPRAKNLARRNPRFMQMYRQRDIPVCGGAFRFDRAEMSRVVEANRELLRDFGPWVDAEAMARSTFQYGLSPDWALAMDRPVSRKMTYSDILSYVATRCERSTAYLEIGVSVGKNLWQVLNHVKDGTVAALDIEDPSPPLKARLSQISATTVSSGHPSPRKHAPSVERFDFPARGNSVAYYAGDVFDPAVWRELETSGVKFNLVFSDAFHDPDAIRFEWRQLVDRGLLDKQGFTMLWDDLVSREIRQVFNDIVLDCIRLFGMTRRNACLMHVSGWVGEFEPPHPIGLISNQGFVV